MDDIQDVQEVQETPVENLDSEIEETDVDDLKRRAEASSKNFERAKKAEEEVKRLRDELKKANPEASSSKDLASADVIYLAKADIHEDDVNDVVEYAKKMGVSVKEAHTFFKPILSERAEQRKSAEISITKGNRGTHKTSSDDLIAKAKQGKITELSDSDWDRIAEARMAARKGQK